MKLQVSSTKGCNLRLLKTPTLKRRRENFRKNFPKSRTNCVRRPKRPKHSSVSLNRAVRAVSKLLILRIKQRNFKTSGHKKKPTSAIRSKSWRN